jgi:hypothetical protein
LEIVRLEHGGQGYRGDDCRLGIWSPSPALLLFHMVGHGNEGFATPLLAEFDRLTAGGKRIHLFGDLGRMNDYDSMLRIRCTDHFRARLSSFESLHVHVASRLVTMAVSVANVALNGIITMHSSSLSFKRAIDTQIALQGVSDFSSDVLAS